MSIEFIAVTLLLFSTLFLLAASRIPADFVLLGALGFLVVSGILAPNEALEGLSNPGMAKIAVLYVVVAGLRETGTIAWLSRVILGKPQNQSLALMRLIVPASIISAFINNSPVVAMFTTSVQDWCRRSSFKASCFLLPLSYASILGGTCTLIGTSTNLVVDGMMRQNGYPGFSLFELSAVGIPITIIGWVYLLTAGQYLLAEKSGAIEQFDDTREYMVEMLVKPGCELAGQTVQDAGLRHLPGLYLIEIVRQEEIFSVVSPDTLIHAEDRLVFAGAVESVIELRRIRGLVVAPEQIFKLGGQQHDRRLFEAVISAESPVVGMNIRQARFRHRYNAVILAVSRDGHRLKGKIGDFTLLQGDTLLMEAQKGFLFKFRNSRDFLLVSKLDNSAHIQHDRAPLALGITGLMIILIFTGFLDILQASILAAGAMLTTGCLSIESARRGIDYQVLLVIACAFALGAAVQKVGLASLIAEQAMAISGNDPWLMLVLIYLATILLTETITNNAAAIVMFPIAISGAESLGVNVVPFSVAVMIAASASFITPIGYQTNLMVYGPGGYRFSDYIKLGLPLSILVAIVALGIIPEVWPFNE